MNFLTQEIEALGMMISHADKQQGSVSARGIDWHIDHSLKAIIGICEVLKRSNPQEYRWGFSMARAYVFMRNSIPRGVGKAPKVVVAQDEITLGDLHKQVAQAKKGVQQLQKLPPKSHFKHPYFGVLNLRMSKWFLKIHTRHHLKIMEDIIQTS